MKITAVHAEVAHENTPLPVRYIQQPQEPGSILQILSIRKISALCTIAVLLNKGRRHSWMAAQIKNKAS